MTLCLARRESEQPGPLPLPGAEIWLEDLPVGPVSTLVIEVREARIRVEPPRIGGNVAEVPDDRPLVLTYSAADLPCEARARRDGSVDAGGEGIWLTVEAVERMQRRTAVRVPVQLMARVVRGDDGASSEVAEEAETGITEDLSARGVLVRFRTALPVDSTVRLQVHCGVGGEVDVLARVVRVEHDERSARPFRTALAFPDLQGSDESRLVRFLFDRQRQLRRREIGLD